MSRFLIHDHNNDGINRSQAFGKNPASGSKGELNFVQISDSHIGFNKPANPDVSATLQAAVDKINAYLKAPLPNASGFCNFLPNRDRKEACRQDRFLHIRVVEDA